MVLIVTEIVFVGSDPGILWNLLMTMTSVCQEFYTFCPQIPLKRLTILSTTILTHRLQQKLSQKQHEIPNIKLGKFNKVCSLIQCCA